jgi:hypothetical protein
MRMMTIRTRIFLWLLFFVDGTSISFPQYIAGKACHVLKKFRSTFDTSWRTEHEDVKHLITVRGEVSNHERKAARGLLTRRTGLLLPLRVFPAQRRRESIASVVAAGKRHSIH